ncbi:F0F1 ATP synthase subunit delta [Aquabacterium sp. A7-Y]|uniref:F0F1 ATP synthase subunit delta n=1 Tax=Aquabacterium sp. A7-Y TaxID=1349605 RepID=UPI00223E37E1|nr:F0F1 ATP synthase subunit delta [Aquabacterium sp. A7-Y]MCW7539547.1 F0F1 ATP synthase subunit delta [Aquabacterium sp. A7-Y]
MAELATIARPYAEALFEVARKGDLNQWAAEVDTLAAVVANPQLRELADNPRVPRSQVFDVVTSVAGGSLSEGARNLIATLIDNRRLSAMPEIATQFRALKHASEGATDATVYSAFPVTDAQLADLVGTLEKRFGRKLLPTVEVQPELIGGVRVVVGDEVLDTSVKARLERMKAALIA